MEKYVVTISRQFASLGRTIAQKMSEELGINFYDRDLVARAARRMGQTLEDISMQEEHGAPFLGGNRHYPFGMEMLSVKQETFYVQSNIIQDLANKESCIIVGRCADYILRDRERHLNVYIYAPYEERLKNCIETLEMDKKTAIRTIHDVDRARVQYRQRFSKGRKTQFDYRDLMIDSSRFGAEKTAHILCDVVREVFY